MSKVPTIAELNALATKVWPGKHRVRRLGRGWEIWSANPNRYCGSVDVADTAAGNRIALAAALRALAGEKGSK